VLADTDIFKAMSRITALFKVFILAALMVPLVTRGQVIRPNVQVGVVCLDAASGKVIWRHWFGRKLLFTGYQFSENRVIVRFSELPGQNDDEDDTKNSRAAFLDVKTGNTVPPFYLLPPSCELAFSNGWTSYGVKNLEWHNVGSNPIYFFDERFNLVGVNK
jgi:hypothetical protein